MPKLKLRPDPQLADWPVNGLIGILDLEFTAWDGSHKRDWSESWEWREIVQIGLVLADAGKAFAVREAIEIEVQPLRNPVLSEYFTALTGITQASLARTARPFDEAMKMLAAVGAPAGAIIFNGADGEILRENCAMRDVPPPWPEAKMFNFHPMLAHALRRASSELTSSDLPALAGISVPGSAHSALHDCRAIAAAFARWREIGIL